MEGISDMNEDGARNVTPRWEVVEFNEYKDSTMKMHYCLGEDIVALAQYGQKKNNMYEGRQKMGARGIATYKCEGLIWLYYQINLVLVVNRK